MAAAGIGGVPWRNPHGIRRSGSPARGARGSAGGRRRGTTSGRLVDQPLDAARRPRHGAGPSGRGPRPTPPGPRGDGARRARRGGRRLSPRDDGEHGGRSGAPRGQSRDGLFRPLPRFEPQQLFSVRKHVASLCPRHGGRRAHAATGAPRDRLRCGRGGRDSPTGRRPALLLGCRWRCRARDLGWSRCGPPLRGRVSARRTRRDDAARTRRDRAQSEFLASESSRFFGLLRRPPSRYDWPMDIKRSGSQPSVKGPAEWFTGTVRVDPLFEAPAPARVSAASVTFEPGARAAWHTHPLGQTLIVTAGAGLAQRWGGPIEQIRPGDVIWIPPGEKQWHGAAATTAMTHIAIQEHLNGKPVDWMEKVSDEQYRSE